MRYHEIINERTFDNMSLLREMTDLIISITPDYIPKNEKVAKHLPDYSDKIFNMFEKYGEKYYKIRDLFMKLTILWDNTFNGSFTPTLGSYAVSKYEPIMNLNVSLFMASEEEHSKKDILSRRAEHYPTKTFRAIILHELRHLVQHASFEKHMVKSTDDTYSTSSIEIDAAYHHHLEDFNVSDYDDVKEFIKSVLTSFSSYKKLSDKQKKHYISKTASYYYASKNPENHIGNTTKERQENKINKLGEELITGLDKLNGDIDLRQYIDGYEANNWTLPYRMVTAIQQMIMGRNKLPPTHAAVIYTIMATTDIDKDKILNYLTKAGGITLQDALDGVSSSLAGLDVDAIKNMLVKKFK